MEISLAVAPMDEQVTAFLLTIPLRLMWIAVGLFTLGAFIQDIYNPGSRLRSWLRDRRRIFSIGDFMITSYQNGRSLSLTLTLEHSLRSATVVVRFTAIQQASTLARGKHKVRWHDVASGEQLPIPIASVSAAMTDHCPSEMVWWGSAVETAWGNGDRDAQNQPAAITRIDIKARSLWRLQHETIFAVCRNYNSMHANFLFWRGENEVIYASD